MYIYIHIYVHAGIHISHKWSIERALFCIDSNVYIKLALCALSFLPSFLPCHTPKWNTARGQSSPQSAAFIPTLVFKALLNTAKLSYPELDFDTGPAQQDFKNKFCIEGRFCDRRKRAPAKESYVPNERRATTQHPQAHNFWRKVSGSARMPQKPPLMPSKKSSRQRYTPQNERLEEDSELGVH
jgi:hypothetical protein